MRLTGPANIHGRYMFPSGVAEWIIPKNVKPAKRRRYTADLPSRRSISSARKAPHNIAVKMKPLPSATMTSRGGKLAPGVRSASLKFAGGRKLDNSICSKRATEGKKANATAGACLAGHARNAWHVI